MRSRIREDEIIDGRHYGGYESPHDSDLDVDFVKHDYLNLSYVHQHGALDDEHEAPEMRRFSRSFWHSMIHTRPLLNSQLLYHRMLIKHHMICLGFMKSSGMCRYVL
ncbi:hypothetical protein Sjap_025891 [Stephania japonica]|uniref:Uncharacterized protein n=1 Tax=Stephania japonica TaxID=461633 RepID=A0AAP0E2G5_9MAGN